MRRQDQNRPDLAQSLTSPQGPDIFVDLTPCLPLQPHSPSVPLCSLPPSSHLELLYFLPHAKHLPWLRACLLGGTASLPASSLLLSCPYPVINWLMDAKQKQLIRHPHGAVLGPQVWGSGEGTDLGIITFAEVVYPFLPIVKTFLLHSKTDPKVSY